MDIPISAVMGLVVGGVLAAVGWCALVLSGRGSDAERGGPHG